MAAQGYHGDTSRMFPVGQVSDKAQHLCNVTLEALEAAVSQCGPNVPVRRIGEVLSVHMPFPIGLDGGTRDAWRGHKLLQRSSEDLADEVHSLFQNAERH